MCPSRPRVGSELKDCIGSLSSLLTDLLDLSKLEAGVVKPNIGDFHVADILATWNPSMSRKHTEGTESARSRHPLHRMHRPGPVQAPARQFHRQRHPYTERGGIRIGCRRRGGKTWVEVWDSGIGIAADKTTEIFEEFKQLGDDARNRGSGLGLAIVAKTATLLGLDIRVASRPGRGSMFAVDLPAGRHAPVSAPMPQDVVCRSLRVALVEDNTMVRQAFARAWQMQAISDCRRERRGAGSPARRSAAGHPGFRLPACTGRNRFDVIAATRAAAGTELPAILITATRTRSCCAAWLIKALSCCTSG